MTRYEKIDQIITKANPEELRECQSKGACACRGCFRSLGITQSDYQKWKERNFLTIK